MNSGRRRLVAVAIGASALVSGLATSLQVPAQSATEPMASGAISLAGAGAPNLRILSSPDFLNADVGDVSGLPRWDGEHNSTNASYEASLDVVLDQFAAEQPDQVLVAGDLVEGHWGTDHEDTGIFGPVRTPEQRLAAARRAGDLYYSAWVDRFTERGLPVPHVAVGDHEVGDDPWRRTPYAVRAVAERKQTFADHLIGGRYPMTRRPWGTPFADTSYAQPLGGGVLLVTVDLFQPTDHGPEALEVSLSGKHLRWFEGVLDQGRELYDWVVVQAHAPAAGPVRSFGSSELRVVGGERSAFWQAMVEHDVDLYLAGEVHRVTAIDPEEGPVQVTHGGLFAYSDTNYLLLDVHGDRIELASYGFAGSSQREEGSMWQVSRKRATPIEVTYEPGRVPLGTAVLGHDRVLRERTGLLAPATELGNRS